MLRIDDYKIIILFIYFIIGIELAEIARREADRDLISTLTSYVMLVPFWLPILLIMIQVWFFKGYPNSHRSHRIQGRE